MFLTIIVILLLVVAVVGGYLGWCQYAQRDQRPGRHRSDSLVYRSESA